jgi:hypothetical protein
MKSEKNIKPKKNLEKITKLAKIATYRSNK